MIKSLGSIVKAIGRIMFFFFLFPFIPFNGALNTFTWILKLQGFKTKKRCLGAQLIGHLQIEAIVTLNSTFFVFVTVFVFLPNYFPIEEKRKTTLWLCSTQVLCTGSFSILQPKTLLVLLDCHLTHNATTSIRQSILKNQNFQF